MNTWKFGACYNRREANISIAEIGAVASVARANYASRLGGSMEPTHKGNVVGVSCDRDFETMQVIFVTEHFYTKIKLAWILVL